MTIAVLSKLDTDNRIGLIRASDMTSCPTLILMDKSSLRLMDQSADRPNIDFWEPLVAKRDGGNDIFLVLLFFN